MGLSFPEDNNGGEMVEHTLRMADRQVPVKRVHASRGKRPRAEPVSVLYTEAPSRPRLAFHSGFFPQLEDQLDAPEVALTDEILDRIDELAPPGTDVDTRDAYFQAQAIVHAKLRRRR